jgi:hypothetical protein
MTQNTSNLRERIATLHRQHSQFVGVAAWICIWFVASPTVINFIKILTSTQTLEFPHPWMLVVFVSASVWLFSTLALYLPANWLPHESADVVIPWKQAAVLGCLVGIEVGLGNDILRRISITMRTEIVMLCPVFMFLCGILMGVESFTPRLGLAVASATVGGVLAAYGSISWEGIHLVPWAFVVAILGAFRWTLTQKWLSPAGQTKPSALVLSARCQPFTALVGLVMCTFHDRDAFAKLIYLPYPETVALLCFAIGFGVFITTISEMCIVQMTSALRLAFFVPFHNVLLIFMDAAIRGSPISQLNCIGLILCAVSMVVLAMARSDKKDSMPRPIEEHPSETDALLEDNP